VLRSQPPIDNVAAQIFWSESMDELAARRKTGRFANDPQAQQGASRDVLHR
jgi:hypothetical protein